MNCERFESAIHEYLRGTLPETERAEVDRHVAGCSRCTELIDRLQELTCKDFVEFLNDFIDGHLESQRQSVFERHLSLCPDCTNYMRSYRRTMELSVSALRDEAVVPEEIPEELIRAILAARK